MEKGFRSRRSIEDLEAEIADLERVDETEEEDVVEEVVPEEEKPLTTEVKEEALTPEEETFKKRYGDLRRFQQQREAELNARIKQLESASNKGSFEAPPKTPEEVQAWMRKYPDIAGIVLSLVEEKSGSKNLDTRLQAIEQKEQELAKRQAISALKERHPDFDDLVAPTSKLHKWAGEQPSWIQDILYEGTNPTDVARILDLYKTENGIKTKRPQSQEQEAAKAVTGPSKTTPNVGTKGRTFKESEVADMSPEEYEKLESEILAAHREGRIIHDIRAGAY